MQAWSPWYTSDMRLLEQVQVRAVSMVIGLKAKTYAERLSELGMLSLADRRIRGDAIQVW